MKLLLSGGGGATGMAGAAGADCSPGAATGSPPAAIFAVASTPATLLSSFGATGPPAAKDVAEIADIKIKKAKQCKNDRDPVVVKLVDSLSSAPIQPSCTGRSVVSCWRWLIRLGLHSRGKTTPDQERPFHVVVSLLKMMLRYLGRQTNYLKESGIEIDTIPMPLLGADGSSRDISPGGLAG
jgi:hypothetical protein